MAVDRKATAATASTAGVLGVGYPTAKLIALAFVTGEWTPEAQDALATVLAFLGVSLVAGLITAWITVRQRLVRRLTGDDPEDTTEEEVVLVEEMLPKAKGWLKSLMPKRQRVRIVPRDEDTEFVKGLRDES